MPTDEADDTSNESTEPQEGEETDAEQKTFSAEYVEKLRREAAKHRNEAKQNAEAATRLRELEDAEKTELQKLTDERDTHKQRGDTAELQAARFEVALDKGLSRTQAKRLVGTTREELEADADELLADLGKDTGPRPPKPHPAQSGREAKPTSGDWLRDQFAGRT